MTILELPHCYTFSFGGIEREIAIYYDRDALLDEFSKITLRERYMSATETSPQEAFARAACMFSDDNNHAQRLYNYASKQWFMFATPVLSNGGTDRGMPISCFLNYVEDSREGILSHYTENGWLASMGGGIGTYWGALRSLGASTSKGSKSSGVVPFTKIVDAEMLAFAQGKTRRGSAAVYLDISHPEIEEWLVMRKMSGGDPNRKTPNLHNGVCITDDFMNAVESGSQFELVDPHTKKVTKIVSARDLWRMLLDVRLETGEPYIFFVDAANDALPQPLKDLGLRINASNLCTEIMLPTGRDKAGKMRTAVCCLSSVNLAHFDTWKHDQMFIADLMRMLDNVLENYIQTAPESHANAVYSAASERSVGLGAMGLHTYFQEHMISFDSAEARAVNVMMFEHLKKYTLIANKRLGEERGEAPDMVGTGLRFAHTMAIAPNASSSIICSSVSPSIEPIRANAYLHKTLSGSTPIPNRTLVKVLQKYNIDTPTTWKQILVDKGSVVNLDLPDHVKRVFLTAIELDQRAIIQLAADRQLYIDQGQSVNLFFDPQPEAQYLHDVHMLAWKMRMKALYYLRSEAVQRANLTALSNIRAATPQEETECLACEG